MDQPTMRNSTNRNNEEQHKKDIAFDIVKKRTRGHTAKATIIEDKNGNTLTDIGENIARSYITTKEK